MPKQKKSNKDLLYVLSLLSKKREELVSPFLDKEPEWIGPTFKYERNQPAFDLVREKFFTLWIDTHFTQLMADNIAEDVRIKALGIFSELMNASKTDMDDSSIKHSMLSTKVSVIKELLRNENNLNKKYNEIKLAYERDKALFEREFQKYEIEMNRQ